MLIKINDLNVQYGNKKVLQNFNLILAEREIVTIVGPNGSGKTTLFKAIIGTTPIKTGTVELKPNLKIGYVPQQLNIDRSLPLTVDRFLRLTQNKLKNTLKIVNIEDILNVQISNLSGGQMQRVLLASAIVNRPDVLLLDEATRGLDQPGTAAFYRLVETIRKETGCAILMISHDLHVVMAASDRVICLNTHICCEGAPQAVARSPEYKALFGPDIDGAFALYQHSHSVKKENEKVY
jgi:zinc transport system ATP-binding protein